MCTHIHTIRTSSLRWLHPFNGHFSAESRLVGFPRVFFLPLLPEENILGQMSHDLYGSSCYPTNSVKALNASLRGLLLLLLLHPSDGLFSRTTLINQHQKGKAFWIWLEQEMMGWRWHQLDHMQMICTSLQTDLQTPVPHHSVFLQPDALPATQPTASKHWRLIK